MLTHNTTSQCFNIMQYLHNGNSLTSLEALNMFGCMRLPARVDDLRKEGHKIITTMIKLDSGKRVASYSLEMTK